MDVILVEDVQHLGHMGDLVTVKAGYGRNYLVPKGLAILATAGSKAELAHHMRQISAKKEKFRVEAEAVGGKINGVNVTITRQAGDDNKLFGSVSNRDVGRALEELGIEVDRRRIAISEPIRALGIYAVPVKLHADVTAEIRVWVCKA